jgi:hypothetical protein
MKQRRNRAIGSRGWTLARFCPCWQGDKRSPSVDGMAMDTGLYRVEMTGLSRLAETIGSFSRWPEKAAVRYFQPRLIWLPSAILILAGAWMLLPGSASNTPQTSNSEPVRLAVAAAVTESAPLSTDVGQDMPSLLSPETTPAGAITPMEMSPLDGLKISSQSWRRGGLGSKALVTLTLRNTNDYAVKDIEIFCSFARRDGSHLTDRKRVIPDIVNMRSRRTFARMHVGFVNINADRAKCSLVAASQV